VSDGNEWNFRKSRSMLTGRHLYRIFWNWVVLVVELVAETELVIAQELLEWNRILEVEKRKWKWT
jgi:hypothetical protein